MPALVAKDIRLEKVVASGVECVSGDPARLQQVLWNLLTNAIKFTPKGGKIQVLAHRVASHLEISVTDTGEGIAPEFLPQLFERFSQADALDNAKSRRAWTGFIHRSPSSRNAWRHDSRRKPRRGPGRHFRMLAFPYSL